MSWPERTSERDGVRQPWRRRVSIVGRAALFLALGYFIIRAVLGLLATTPDERLTVSLGPLLASAALLLVYYIAFAQGMVLILRAMGATIRLRDAFALNFISNLGKYLPGGVWPILGRYALASRFGVSAEHAVMSTVFENLLSVVAGTIVVLVAIGPAAADAMNVSPYLLVLVAAGILACLHPVVFGRLSRVALRLLKSDVREVSLPVAAMLRVVVHYALTWCLGGIAFAVFVGSITVGDPGTLSLYIGAFAAASIGGLLVLFAPGGIGVREAILAGLLAPSYPLAVAVAAGVAARLWSTAVELLASGVSALMTHRRVQSGPEA
ncbi:MAG: lysylphosphatidylglycerol synthase domain-containing protein [Coriobacteriia bacterium]